MNVFSKYKKWLNKTCKYFSLQPNSILDTNNRSRYISTARMVFYTLCLRDGIDLYDLSIRLGKHRTTIYCSVKQSKINIKKHLDKLWKIK